MSYYRDVTRTATRERKCNKCGKPIHIGDRYMDKAILMKDYEVRYENWCMECEVTNERLL